MHPQGGQWLVGPPELLALQKSPAGWDKLSCPAECRMRHQPHQMSVLWSVRLWVSSRAASWCKATSVPATGICASQWPVTGRRWLPQSTAMHSLSPCLGGTAAANLIREKRQFYSQQSRDPGMGLTCHPLSQPQLNSATWSLRNYCKRSKALRKAGVRGVFQVTSSKAFFISEDSDFALLLSE